MKSLSNFRIAKFNRKRRRLFQIVRGEGLKLLQAKVGARKKTLNKLGEMHTADDDINFSITAIISYLGHYNT